MIQTIPTLTDKNILKLPGNRKVRSIDNMLTSEDRQPPVRLLQSDEEEQTPVEQARENYFSTLENKKVNIDSLLMDDPEKPELDQSQIDRNKKMARNMALMQVVDSLAGVANIAANQEGAITTPSRFGEMGLSAVDNIRNLQDEHKLGLQQYQQKQDQVDQFNRQLTHETDQFNREIDADIAGQRFEMATAEELQKKKDELEKTTREALAKDKQKEQYFELAIRMTSAGETQAAHQFARMAGLGNEEIDRILGGSGSGFTQQQATLYNEYDHYNELASEDDYTIEAGDRKVKKGSPTWHRDRLMDSLGDDFYMIDFTMRQQREAEQAEIAERESVESSEALQRDPKVQEGVNRANITVQKQLMSNILNAPDPETRQKATNYWLEQNTDLLKEAGVPDDQVDQYNERMFARMLQEISGSGTDPEPVEESEPRMAEETDRAPAAPETDPVDDIPVYLRHSFNTLKDIDRVKKINQRVLDGDHPEHIKDQARNELERQEEKERQLLGRMRGIDRDHIAVLERALGRDISNNLAQN